MAHMTPKLLKMANMAQYGSLWPIGFHAAPYGSLWLQMALYGSNCYIWLNTAPNFSYGPQTSTDDPNDSIWLYIAYMAYPALHGSLWLQMALYGS